MALAGALVLVAQTGSAANWTIEPRLRVAQTWTDNADQVAEDPEHEWISEVTPGLRISGEGQRAQLDLDYRMRNLYFVRDAGRDRTDHEGAAEGSIELVRERLFIDADVARSRQVLGAGGVVPAAGAFTGEERRNTVALGAGPRLQYQLGRAANLSTAYRRERVQADASQFRTTDTDLYTAGLTSGPLFTRWGWAVDYSRREETRQRSARADEAVVLELIRGELNLRTGAASQLFVAGGQERNEFPTAEASDAIDGGFWEAGARWHPRRTVALEAAVGERFFSETARFSLDLRGSALRVRLAYNATLITSSQLQFERSMRLVRDEEGNLVLDPEGRPLTSVVGVPTVIDDVIVQRRGELRTTWERGYSRLRLIVLGTEREFQREGTTEQAQRADLDWHWTRLARTPLRSGIGYSRQEFQASNRLDETYSLRLGAQRDLGRNFDLSLDYEHFVRESNLAAAEHTTNRITLALEKTF